MQPLIWCFFSFRGHLNRQEFALSVAVLWLVSFAITPLMRDVVTGGELPPGGLTEAQELQIMVMGSALAGLILLWPTLAVQAKRLQHIGLKAAYLLIFYFASGFVFLFMPMLVVLATVVLWIGLFALPGGQWQRWTKRT
jgi:uncharacterized membrane protein YhaH (DUF805 family)